MARMASKLGAKSGEKPWSGIQGSDIFQPGKLFEADTKLCVEFRRYDSLTCPIDRRLQKKHV